MAKTTIIRNVRSLVDRRKILDALLRQLLQNKTISPEDLDRVMSITIEKVADTLQAQAISVFMVDKKTGRIRFQNVYYSPLLHGDDPIKKRVYERRAEELERLSLAPGQGIVGQVIATGEPAFVPDAHSDPRFYGQIEQDTGFVTRSMIAVPLKVGNEVVGAIQVLNKWIGGKAGQFTQEDVYLLQDIADYSAKVIQRARDPNTPFSEREMAQFVARHSKCPYIEPDPKKDIDVPLLEKVGGETLKRYQILPLKMLDEKSIRAAISNPLDFQRIEDFEIVTGMKVAEKFVAAAGDIRDVILKFFPEASKADEAAERLRAEFDAAKTPETAGETVSVETEDENSAPIVALANRIVEEAYTQGASDIHLEPQEDKVTVRYRIDGLCREKLILPKAAHRALVSRIKIMAELDIAERRLPQDGRIVFKKFNTKYDLDLRVSVAPMNHGEKVCMRILDKTKSALPLDKLGFSDYNLALYRKQIQAPYGMILHCGPTGSGKSMTLYAALNEINSPELNISTAEDPIEYTIKGINQLQVRKDIGLTFAAALRCFLRQDPDIILVGEIRDEETAEIAVEAALTGHLLFSTLHTNDAPTTIPRFIEMGIEPYMVATSLVCICAQRLLRRVCSCAALDDPKPAEIELLKRAKDGRPIGKIKRLVGCDRCANSGMKGRTGIHEVLVNNDELREIINRGGNADEIRLAARRTGMRTLFEDCMEKVKL
ncbi:MAG: GspE/PulE family protein, partial [Planctomycetota bacterium]|nr:GspE/PulE family protein [Planctomycetota bacterium]